MEKKVLIIGSGLAADALREKLFTQSVEAFLSGDIDIREDKPFELLEFCLEHDINLTVVLSKKALACGIANLFRNNAQVIFAPCDAGILSKSGCKKMLYGERIPTPRFGVFERTNLALDYLKNVEFPVIIENGNIFSSFDQARRFVENLFTKNKEITIAQYVYGHAFTLYLITDGAGIEVISSSCDTGKHCYAPDYKVSSRLENEIVRAIAPLLECQCGIFGIQCVLKEDGHFSILGIDLFFVPTVAKAMLDLIEEDVYSLLKACALGSFADDYENLKISQDSIVAKMQGNKPIYAKARTLSRAINNLEDLDEELSTMAMA
jgi:phosphoribosylamine-glycine ligase